METTWSEIKKYGKMYWQTLKSEGKEAGAQLLSKNWYRQIPNMITLMRIVLAIPVSILALLGGWTVAFPLAIALALTDFVDGKIAKIFHLQSSFGKKLDQIGDKLFILIAGIPVMITQPVLTLLLIPEAMILKINLLDTLKEQEIDSVLSGRIKTWPLFATVVAAYLSHCITISPLLIPTLGIMTMGMQMKTCYDYQKLKMMKRKLEMLENERYFTTDPTIILDIDQKIKQLKRKQPLHSPLQLNYIQKVISNFHKKTNETLPPTILDVPQPHDEETIKTLPSDSFKNSEFPLEPEERLVPHTKSLGQNYRF